MQFLIVCGFLVALSAALSTAPSANAQPSFDCNQARTENELLICSNADLGSMDREVSQLYGDLRKGMNAFAADNLKQGQRQWLRQRNRCRANFDCTRNLYQQRIDYLFQEFNALGQ